MLITGIGEEGQRRLLASHALIVGCGALGGMIADILARAGVGTLTVVDRDIVDLTNLHRQVLFDEADVEAGIPKAEAAKARIGRINREVIVHAHVDDFGPRNAARFIEGVDVILDGLDNFETRYLLNDLAVKFFLPYIYGGAVGTTGLSMPILPPLAHRQMRRASETAAGGVEADRAVVWTDTQSTPCLRCVFPDAPRPGSSPTCDTAGILGPAAAIIASHQATQALKLLTGNIEDLDRSLLSIDVWSNQFRRIDLSAGRSAGCSCCGDRRFDYLEGDAAGEAVHLCGRDSVQIPPPRCVTAGERDTVALDLDEIARRLAPHGEFTRNRFLLRGVFHDERSEKDEPLELTLFPNGRAVIRGTDRINVARSLYARYVGS